MKEHNPYIDRFFFFFFVRNFFFFCYFSSFFFFSEKKKKNRRIRVVILFFRNLHKKKITEACERTAIMQFSVREDKQESKGGNYNTTL